jgi:hypothetical protein
MTTLIRGMFFLSLSVVALSPFVGCDTGGDAGGGQASQSPPGSNGPPPGPGGPGPASGIRQIMNKVGRGPNALNAVLGKELSEPEPPWDTIQGQVKEYLGLTEELAKLDPPLGSKENWAKATAAYIASVTDLEKSAQAKAKDASLAAHGQLTNACDTCHREHRRSRPGMGGPRGGFRGGPPGGMPGGPPGAPGGPPDGGPPPGGRPPG